MTLAAQMAVVPSYRAPEPPAVRAYAAPRAPMPVTVDGVLDDAAWTLAPWSDPFLDIEGDRRPAPRYATRVKLAWDDEFLYVAAELEDADLWATLTTRDAIVFHDNDFEVFIDPDGDTHDYYELEINALNTVWDLRLVKPYRDGGPALTPWDLIGLRTAVRLDGTLNDPADRDHGWSVELALPWRALSADSTSGVVPALGATWRINFSRVQWRLDPEDGGYQRRRDSTGKLMAEDNWVWSPQDAINMHMPEMWGVVTFVEDASAAPDDVAARERWTLRRVYYQQRAFRRTHGRWALAAELEGFAGVTLRVTDQGWTAHLGTWRIQEDGRVWNDAHSLPR